MIKTLKSLKQYLDENNIPYKSRNGSVGIKPHISVKHGIHRLVDSGIISHKLIGKYLNYTEKEA